MLLHETVPQLAQLEGPENTPISPISPARYRQMTESIRERTADAWIRFVEAVFVQLYLNADQRSTTRLAGQTALRAHSPGTARRP